MAKHDTNTSKKSSLTMRVTNELHDKLSKAATENLVSVSAEAERRLIRTFHEDELAGDARLSALLRHMASASSLIVETQGQLKTSARARELVHELWLEAVERFLPMITDMNRPPAHVRRLMHERGRLQRAFRIDRESRGLEPSPQLHTEGTDFRNGNLILEDGRVVGGAVDALAQEYAKQILDPSPEEIRWAEITDQIAIINHERRTPSSAKAGATVKLVRAMLNDLTPKERKAILDDLSSE